MRRGVSLTLSYIVIAMLLLSVAVVLLGYFTGGISKLEAIVSGQQEVSGNEIAKESCITQKQRLCDNFQDGSTGWADDTASPTATYNGKNCATFWQENNEPVPTC